jgi:hypothetical protein
MSMADMRGIAPKVFSVCLASSPSKSDDVYNYIGCCCWRWSVGIATLGRTHTIYKNSSLLPIGTSRFSRNRKICENSYPYLTIFLELSAHGLMTRWNCPIVARRAASMAQHERRPTLSTTFGVISSKTKLRTIRFATATTSASTSQ